MSKYDFVSQLLSEVPSVIVTYFGMIVSGNQSAIIGGILGLLGLTYVVFKLLRSFWLKIILNSI